jgi:serine/threonine protein kinase
VSAKRCTESPFYFTGNYHPINGKPVKVFCKVWHEGDRETNRNLVLLEMDMLNQAYQSGVSCPKMVDGLTAIDIVMEGETYHLLVMTYHQQNDVREGDLLLFVQSLINEVSKLHMSGILHCDIKPANISWDTKDKVVYVLDFGHAQQEIGASARKGTLEVKTLLLTVASQMPIVWGVHCLMYWTNSMLLIARKCISFCGPLLASCRTHYLARRIMLSHALQLLETKPLTKSLSLTN